MAGNLKCSGTSDLDKATEVKFCHFFAGNISISTEIKSSFLESCFTNMIIAVCRDVGDLDLYFKVTKAKLYTLENIKANIIRDPASLT